MGTGCLSGPDRWSADLQKYYGPARWDKICLSMVGVSPDDTSETKTERRFPTHVGIWPVTSIPINSESVSPILEPLIYRCDDSHSEPSLRDAYLIDTASLVPPLLFSLVDHDARDSFRVLDLCGAPGGKSLVLASILLKKESTIQLVVNDSSRSRVERLKHTFSKHYPNRNSQLSITCCDPLKSIDLLQRLGPFDCILVDAPCSTDKELLTKGKLPTWTPKLPKTNSERQLQLLNAAASLLRKTSKSQIVYSTCALHQQENDGVVEAFLSEKNKKNRHNSNFRVEDLNDCVSVLSTNCPKIRWELAAQSIELCNMPLDDDGCCKCILDRCIFGVMILPDINRLCGPIFASKLILSI